LKRGDTVEVLARLDHLAEKLIALAIQVLQSE
jgi:hypothetical protein